MPKNEELNEVLKRIKSVYHLNQKEVAERIGVHYHYLSNVLNGHYPYNDELKRKIARAFTERHDEATPIHNTRERVGIPIVSQYTYAGYLSGCLDPLLAVEQQRRILLRKVAETLR